MKNDRFRESTDNNDAYEPTEEEWVEIDEMIAKEEQSLDIYFTEFDNDEDELNVFKQWAKRNGMIW